MSDLTMAKIRALYEDMVLMEKNMKTMEQKMRMDMVRLEKKVSEPGAAGSSSMPLVVVAALITFILGLAFALAFSRPWWVSLGLVLPGLSFLFLTWLWMERRRNQPPAHEKPVARTRTQEQSQASALEQFQAACLAARPQVQGRNRDACRDVLLNGMTVEAAAARHKLFVDAVQECVERLKNS